MKITKGAVGAAVLAMVFAAGCTYEPDAERRADELSPALVIAMPDHFSNIATKCVDGMRYSTIQNRGGSYGALSVVADPLCATTGAETEQAGPENG